MDNAITGASWKNKEERSENQGPSTHQDLLVEFIGDLDFIEGDGKNVDFIKEITILKCLKGKKKKSKILSMGQCW